jgi:hypothetical protein
MSTGITLSNGNLTATTAGAGPFGVRAVHSASSGKYYWEAHVDSFVDAFIPGVADSTASFTASWWGITANPHAAGWFGTTLRYNTTTQTVANMANGATLSFALDVSAKKLWVAFNGTWQNGNPATATGGLDITGIGSPVFVGWQGDSGDKVTYNFGATSYTYTPPTGFGNMLLPFLFLPSRRRTRRAMRRRASRGPGAANRGVTALPRRCARACA